jgi:hypothetical protein
VATGKCFVRSCSNMMGDGGYVLAEASDPKVNRRVRLKVQLWNDINAVPVIDVGESVPIGAVSLARATSA